MNPVHACLEYEVMLFNRDLFADCICKFFQTEAHVLIRALFAPAAHVVVALLVGAVDPRVGQVAVALEDVLVQLQRLLLAPLAFDLSDELFDGVDPRKPFAGVEEVFVDSLLDSLVNFVSFGLVI